MRRSASAIAVWMCTGAALTLGCRPSPESRESGPAPLFPVVRYVDEVAGAADGRLEWGGAVTIDDETRPVLSASGSVVALVRFAEQVPEAGMRRYRVELPPRMRDAPFVFAELLVNLGGRRARQETRLLRPKDAPAPLDLTARFEGLAPGDTTQVVVRGYGALPLAARDVATDPLEVPPGAVLRFGFGVQEVAWRPDAPGLVFEVEALAEGGAPASLFRQAVDPARVEADRG